MSKTNVHKIDYQFIKNKIKNSFYENGRLMGMDLTQKIICFSGGNL